MATLSLISDNFDIAVGLEHVFGLRSPSERQPIAIQICEQAIKTLQLIESIDRESLTEQQQWFIDDAVFVMEELVQKRMPYTK